MSRDWLRYLDTEISRRDQRHAFLWAILISILAAAVYLSRWILWNAPPLGVWDVLVPIGIGAAAFALIGSSVIGRIIGIIHPRSYSVRPVEQWLLLTRLIGTYGIPSSLRYVAAAPLAAIGVAAGLALAWTLEVEAFQWIGWATVIGNAMFVCLVAVIFFGLSPATAASGLSAGAALQGVVDANENASPYWLEFSSRAKSSRLGAFLWMICEVGESTSRPVLNPNSPARSAIRISGAILSHTIKAILFLGPVGLLIWAFVLQTLQHVDLKDVTVRGAIAWLTTLLFCVWFTGAHLYWNTSRQLMEQLRLYCFLEDPTEEEMSQQYLVVHMIIDFGVYVDDDIKTLSSKLARPFAPSVVTPTGDPENSAAS